MNNLILVLLVTLSYSFSARAFETESRRLEELLANSEILVPVSDPTLLSELEKEWVQNLSDQEGGTRCTLAISSHFDRGYTESVGTALYRITQTQHNDTVRSNQQAIVSTSLQLTNEDPRLPLLSFFCNQLVSKEHEGLTLSHVSATTQNQVQFANPLFTEKRLSEARSFYPEIAAIETLVPLHFWAKQSSKNSILPNNYLVQDGEFKKQVDTTRPFCSLGFSPPAFEAYDITLPSQTRYRVPYMQTSAAQFPGSVSHRYSITAEESNPGNRLDIDCSPGPFESFDEIERQLAGVLRFIIAD